MDVRCLVCPGLIDRVVRAEAPPAVAEHFRQHHPGIGLVEGQHWEIRPAPLVCDTCLAVVELPWWEHISTPHTHVDGHLDGDGIWLLCDTCHQLWGSGDLVGWVRRGWSVAVDRAPYLLQDPPTMQAESRRHLADTLRPLLERLDDGRRVTVRPPD